MPSRAWQKRVKITPSAKSVKRTGIGQVARGFERLPELEWFAKVETLAGTITYCFPARRIKVSRQSTQFVVVGPRRMAPDMLQNLEAAVP